MNRWERLFTPRHVNFFSLLLSVLWEYPIVSKGDQPPFTEDIVYNSRAGF